MKFDWKKTLGTVAPTIATALGGPLAGVAVKIAANALGIEASEDAVSDAILSGNPEVLAKLKEAEFKFKSDMKKLDITLEKINAEDRNSARNLAISTTIQPQVVLSCVFIASFVIVLWAVFGGEIEIPDKMMPLATILIGIMSAGVTQILNFFFGSSSGSKEKTQLMSKP